MPEVINIDEAKTPLSRLVEQVAAGSEVIIAKGREAVGAVGEGRRLRQRSFDLGNRQQIRPGEARCLGR